MINVIEINAICDELGTNPPKVVEYANCSAIIILNGDGVKVLIVAEEGMSRESVKHRIAAAFKVKAENIASQDKVDEVTATSKPDIETHAKASHKHETAYVGVSTGSLVPNPKPDPVTPAKEIRAHQESKKAK